MTLSRDHLRRARVNQVPVATEASTTRGLRDERGDMRAAHRGAVTTAALVTFVLLHGPTASAAAHAVMVQPRTSGDIVVNGSFESPQLSPGEWATYGPGQVPGWDPT